MKFLGISFNVSERIGKMIFPQFSFLQLWRHITFICISRWRLPYHNFPTLHANILRTRSDIEKRSTVFFSILSDISSAINMIFGWIFPLMHLSCLQLATINLNAYISSLTVSIDFWLFFSSLISVHCLLLEMGYKNPSEKLIVLNLWVHFILFWQPLFFILSIEHFLKSSTSWGISFYQSFN